MARSRRARLTRWTAVLAAATVTVAACGSDDSADSGSSATTAAAQDETTTAASTESSAAESSDSTEASSNDSTADGGEITVAIVGNPQMEDIASLTPDRSSDPARINGTLTGLATDLEGADALPTAPQRAVLAELSPAIRRFEAAWRGFDEKTLRALAKKLERLGL